MVGITTFSFTDAKKNVKAVSTMSLEAATLCNATSTNSTLALTLNFAVYNNQPAVISINSFSI